MKKILLMGICLTMAMPAMAFECAYSTLQSFVQKARSQQEIQELINQNVNFAEESRCGGSILQLAVRRGNPGVLGAILQQDPNRANNLEKLDAFPIAGVQGEIPILLFAAYYAPNEQIVKLLIDAGANISATDEQGRNLLWYMQYNPVLTNTDLYDKLNKQILMNLAKLNQPADAQQQNQPMANTSQNAQEPQQQPTSSRRQTNNASRLVSED